MFFEKAVNELLEHKRPHLYNTLWKIQFFN